MLLTLSNDIELLKRLDAIYFSEGIFSFFGSLDEESHFVTSETKLINYVIIDASASIKRAKELYDKLSVRLPFSNIVFWSKKPVQVDRAPVISSMAELADFLSKMNENQSSTHDERIFKIVPNEVEARLLGYPLKLTKSEHKILLLLSSVPEYVFSCSEIVSLAFPFSRNLSKNQLAVHVCNINKKSVLISGRKLILNPHKNGYILNSEL